jgi:hypothetical protein
MISGPLAFHTIASRVLAAVEGALEDAGNPVQRSCVVNGTIAWDECDCGLLAVAVGRQYLSNNFPAQLTDIDASQCGAAWLVADLVVQIIRCAPSPQEGSFSPSCGALDSSAQEVITDAWIVMDTVPCLLESMKEDTREIIDYLVRVLTPQGPLGGCVGSELVLTIGVKRGTVT